MHISVFGLNHKTAPIEIREKFYLTPIQQDLFLSELKSNPAVSEAFVLSTCNRTEVYLNCIEMPNTLDAVMKLILDVKKVEFTPELKSHFYAYSNESAVKHLLNVACGLDSMVLGEKQILGQVKTAVERSQHRQMFSRYFNILFNIAIRAAKKAQTETNISCGGSSVSWAAMALAEDILGSLEGASILIIGAGKMGELALNQIRNKGVKNIYLMNRTGSAAETLAESCDGIPVSFDDIKEVLSTIDVCVCAASAPHYILDKKIIEKVMLRRQNRKLILIDISMPRNIDPQVGHVPDVFLSCIDDMRKAVDQNMTRRQAAVSMVEQIIDEKLNAFYAKLDKLPASESIESEFSESIES